MALWRLPRPDFHRLVDTDFQDTPLALRPARSRSRHATLSTESSDSFVASAAAARCSVIKRTQHFRIVLGYGKVLRQNSIARRGPLRGAATARVKSRVKSR